MQALLPYTDGCSVSYEPAYLTKAEADCFKYQLDHPLTVGFQREAEGRYSLTYGDQGLSYCYYNVKRVAQPWPVWLEQTRQNHPELAKFNFCLVNKYNDGHASLGYHADNEPDMVPGVPIFSLSVGAERTFILRKNANHDIKLKIELEHGSLLIMEGNTQKHYMHSVPARARVKDVRYNLTFRKIKR